MSFFGKYLVTSNTKNVECGTVFVSVRGFEQSGINLIKKAVYLGAKTIVLEKAAFFKVQKILFMHEIWDKVVFVNNCRRALAEISSEKLNSPSKKLKIIGITGTKGKTTTVFLIYHILKTSGFNVAMLSGIKNVVGIDEEESQLTTQESDYLHMFFKKCVDSKIEFLVMEVSAHAITLSRVYGIEFEIIGFTNFSQDHLDFYNSMEKYFHAKKSLFEQIRAGGTGVINFDDEWIRKIESRNNDLVKISSCNSNCTGFFEILSDGFDGLKIRLVRENQEILIPTLFGKFNAYNISMAALIAQRLGIPWSKILESLQSFLGVPGRLQRHILKSGAVGFVDYAHNPSSMQSVLSVLSRYTNNLITVFGCGGGRDRKKRAIMGKIAFRHSDQVIITDDNPREENRFKILNEIYGGIKTKNKDQKVEIVPDRQKAIARAAAMSKKGSIIALLGKGHEKYYLIKGKKHFFDDFEEISKF